MKCENDEKQIHEPRALLVMLIATTFEGRTCTHEALVRPEWRSVVHAEAGWAGSKVQMRRIVSGCAKQQRSQQKPNTLLTKRGNFFTVSRKSTAAVRTLRRGNLDVTHCGILR